MYVYASNGGSVYVRTLPTSPSGTYGQLVPHTPVTIVSGPTDGYYQITYSQTGYNTDTGYMESQNLKSSVQGKSNYNYTGWLKPEKTITSVALNTSRLCHLTSGNTGYDGSITLYIYPKGKTKDTYTSGGNSAYNSIYNTMGKNTSTGLNKYFNDVYNGNFAYHSSRTCSHNITHRVSATVYYSDNTSESINFQFTSVPKSN